MKKSSNRPINRRGFLKGAAVGAAAAVTKVPTVSAEPVEPLRGGAIRPSTSQVAAETGPVSVSADVLTSGRPGADHMVDVLNSLDFEFVLSNPGSSFRGLHESMVNYGGNRNPEWITCLHEEISVAMAEGYAQIEGRPPLVMAHGTVGIQHAAMAIYNAFCSRVPVYIVAGNSLDATHRRPGAEWVHSVQDASAMVRDYVKWDDTPVSLPHFSESAIRAYKIAMTPPMAPVVIVADSELQETPFPDDYALRIPRLTIPSAPQGDSAGVAEVAKMLVAAENPVVMAGNKMARTQEGMDLLVRLAETLQTRVEGGRNMPSRHPLNQRGGIGNADVILGLEESDLFGRLNSNRDQLKRTFRSNLREGAKVLSISASDLYTKSNYQDFDRYQEVDLAIAADAEATLPSLIEECRRLITGDRRRVFDERGRTLEAAKVRAFDQARRQAAAGWNSSPINANRLSAELWNLVKDKDWAAGPRNVPGPLWDVTRLYQTMVVAGGVGLGHNMPASVGAALAHRKHGRLMVNVQNDGCLMYTSGVLWTAAHHGIPLLTVVNNNRAYHTEVMHLQRMANRYQRGITSVSTWVGSKIEDPDIDFASLARAMGVFGEGPISNPNDLRPALERAIDVVEGGEPALVDVVIQP